MIRKIVGRQLDILRLGNGRTVPGEFFPHLVKDFSGIRKFQVIQHELDRVELRVVLSPEWQQSDEVTLKSRIASVIGRDTLLVFSPTDEIALTKSGKHRVVINLVDRKDVQQSATRQVDTFAA